MKVETTVPLERAQAELRAARALIRDGFPAQAIVHAYAASLQAASAALLEVGAESPATGAGLIASFDRTLVAQDAVPHNVGRVLRRLFEHRRVVDQALVDVPADEAELALAESERLVSSVGRWIRRQTSDSEHPPAARAS